MNKARLQEEYLNNIRPELKEILGLHNIMEVPKISKIVVNVGAGKDAVSDSKILQTITEALRKITGQQPVRTQAKKSIAGFKLRQGMPIGVKVTLRRKVMYEFLDRLINAALPTVRDFQGLTTRLDGRGGYNLGVKEWIVFPELDYDVIDKVYGLNITIQTTAKKDEHGFELLKAFGMPFKQVTGR